MASSWAGTGAEERDGLPVWATVIDGDVEVCVQDPNRLYDGAPSFFLPPGPIRCPLWARWDDVWAYLDGELTLLYQDF